MTFENCCFVTEEEGDEEAENHKNNPPDREDVEVSSISSFDLEHAKGWVNNHSNPDKDSQVLQGHWDQVGNLLDHNQVPD